MAEDTIVGNKAKRRRVNQNQEELERSRNCPYLDTINRPVLDFDFENLCSVSLSKINVYACLVCGKYFQGRGIGTHAYVHSVATDHHVFLNLNTLKFYCLPDNYEIIDSSLDDITHVLKPTFTSQDIAAFDKTSKLCRAYDDFTYFPGIVGLNNIKANDYCNVVLQAFSHVPKHQRDLQETICFTCVSPRNVTSSCSMFKKNEITEQSDALNFLSWFLNSLHTALNGTKKNSTIVSKTFRGSMKLFSRKVIPINKSIDEKLQLMLKEEYKETCEESQFLYLTLDLPPQPLFKDEMRENIIPQVPIYSLLAKFNGVTEKEYKTYKDSHMKRFEITTLPTYLILYIKRFTKN
ncbi:U4/U6.U5 tri-snRNP-associated protein 2-like protein, partial [Leptotrombidium deliense]